MPLPDAYSAEPPVLSASASGGSPPPLPPPPGPPPDSTTASVNSTATRIVSPSPYSPAGLAGYARTARGRTPSTAMPDEPDSEAGEPGSGRTRPAAAPPGPLTAEPPGTAASADLPAYPSGEAESPGSTSYANASEAVPLPAAYAAEADGDELSSRRGCGGGPDMVALRVNSTTMRSSAPGPYVPLAFGECTRRTDGGGGSAVPTTAIDEDAPSEPGEPGSGSSRTAALPAASDTVPPASAPVPAYSSAAALSLACTVYENTSVRVPLPDSYAAGRTVPFMSSASDGDGDGGPSTHTGSSKCTATAMRSPAAYVPFGDSDSTPATRACTPSTAMSEDAPSEPGRPGSIRSGSASWPAASIIVPPLRAPAPAYSRSAAESPARTVYENASVRVPLPDS